MNYDTLKTEAQKIMMDKEAKEDMTLRLRQAGPQKKRTPFARVLPAAAVLAVAVGAGLILWKGSLNPPAVPKDDPTAEVAVSSEESTAPADGTDAAAADQTTNSDTPTENTQSFHGFMQGSDRTDLADPDESTTAQDSPRQFPEGSNLWMLKGDETAPEMDTLVRSYPGYEPGKYYASAGTRTLSPALSAAIAQYGNDHVVYLLRITVTDFTGEALMTPDAQEAFYQSQIERLWGNGQTDVEFGIYRITDENKNTVVEFIAHLHDPACLDTLNWSPDCFYLLELYDEQSAVK